MLDCSILDDLQISEPENKLICNEDTVWNNHIRYILGIVLPSSLSHDRVKVLIVIQPFAVVARICIVVTKNAASACQLTNLSIHKYCPLWDNKTLELTQCSTSVRQIDGKRIVCSKKKVRGK